MHEKPRLPCTRDYGIFEMHEFNRPLHDDVRLLESMTRVGFMPSSPIQCRRNGNDKLKVIRGHHRLDCAKRLKLPVWYVIDESNTDLFSLEGCRQAWSVRDFAHARASAGDEGCAKILAFQKQHGLTLGAAASLVGGESAGSNHKIRAIKAGTFKVAPDTRQALTVVAITDHCRASGVSFATSSAFVSAVSAVVLVSEFDPAVFRHRVTLYPSLMAKRSTVAECLNEIEALYNYGAKDRRLPLAFKAKEAGKERQRNFGRKKPEKKPKRQ
jgi:hypothetical protein